MVLVASWAGFSGSRLTALTFFAVPACCFVSALQLARSPAGPASLSLLWLYRASQNDTDAVNPLTSSFHQHTHRLVAGQVLHLHWLQELAGPCRPAWHWGQALPSASWQRVPAWLRVQARPSSVLVGVLALACLCSPSAQSPISARGSRWTGRLPGRCQTMQHGRAAGSRFAALPRYAYRLVQAVL